MFVPTGLGIDDNIASWDGKTTEELFITSKQRWQWGISYKSFLNFEWENHP
jgi:hypothetical protein